MLKRFAQILFDQPAHTEADAEQRVRVATCVVLLEAARADDQFTNEEREAVLHAVRDRFDLSEEEAEDLLHEACKARKESSDLWRFTNAINQSFTPEQKLEIIEEVWRLFYSDGTLSAHEDGLAHQLRNLLHINHPKLIEAKMKVLNELRANGN